MPQRSILFVAHVTPPVAMSAARRPAGLTKHLDRLGYRVTVLTSIMSGSGGIPGATRTIRTRDLLVSPLNWRRASFAALKGEGDGTYSGAPSAVAAWVIPDLEVVGWAPFALSRALALIRRERFDCVVTSSPPQSAHLIGVALQRRGLAWVADLRDGWSFEPGERFPPGLRRKLDARLEQAVIARADEVTAVTPPIAEDLRDRVNPRAVTITNGYDPDELPDAGSAGSSAPVATDRYTLAYTGTLAYGGVSPAPLLDGFRQLRDSDPAAAARFELVFAGPTAAADLAELRAPDLEKTVRILGPIVRQRALHLQREADALVILIDERRPSIATGKLYEYLSTGRPILVIGDTSVAARIVREAGAGIIVPSDDPGAIAIALRKLQADDGSLPPPAQDAVERFSYGRLAGEMADAIERAIASRRA